MHRNIPDPLVAYPLKADPNVKTKGADQESAKTGSGSGRLALANAHLAELYRNSWSVFLNRKHTRT